MAEILVECPGCRRHVFADEGRCPFCAQPRRRTVAVLAAAGLTLSGCDNLKALFASSSNTLYGGIENSAGPVPPTGARAAVTGSGVALPDAASPGPAPTEPALGAATPAK